MIELRKPKLTEEKKEEIRNAYQRGDKIKDIIENFKISKQTLYNVIRPK